MVVVSEELLWEVAEPETAPLAPLRTPDTREQEAAARRSLRAQIVRLERELAAAYQTAWDMRAEVPAGSGRSEPQLLSLAELERVRDGLLDRLRSVRGEITLLADRQERKRRQLEQMLLDPGSHRFTRISLHELGERQCGAYEVRPRFGLIGMLAGWWHVKLSSGCPLAGGRGPAPRPVLL